MPNAHDVAAHILRTHGTMSAVRLQKLLYYSHAWHLVSQDAPLFDDTIKAYEHGPVVGQVWNSHRGKAQVGVEHVASECRSALSDDEREVIDAVVAAFDDVSSWGIVDVVHDEDPWLEAFACKQSGKSDRISDRAIKDYYSRLSTLPVSARGKSRVPFIPCAKISYMSNENFDDMFSDPETPDDISGFLAALSSARQSG